MTQFRRIVPAMIAVAAVLILTSCPSNQNSNSRPWSAASLNIPRADQPWKLMSQAGSAYVAMEVPGDLPSLDRYPEAVRRTILARIQLRNQNVEMMTHLAAEMERLLQERTFHRVPQHDRQMNEIVLGVNQSDMVNGNPLYKHEDILRHLPSYTHVELFVPAENAAAARTRLRALNLLSRTTVNPVDIWDKEWEGIPKTHACYTWTQDMFRVSIDEQGKEFLFTPAAYLQADDLSDPDIDYLTHLLDSRQNRAIVRLPIFFHAGNILMGERGNKTLFVGQGMLKLNAQMYFNAVQGMPDNAGVLELLRVTSGADNVRVIRNSAHLFHLDMAMAILEQGVVALIEPLDPENLEPDDRDVLQELRGVLSELGYRIIPIPTLTSRIAVDRSPVNMVAYVDRTNHQRHAFVPEYPDEQVIVNKVRRSLNRMIRDAFANAGITVIPVEDNFSTHRGDIHCVLKVIN